MIGAALRTSLVSIVAAGLLHASAANAADKVRVGSLNNPGDIGFFIADQKGYFKAEGLDVEIIEFKSAGLMMAPLGTGDLDVAGGALNASLFNAAERQLPLKIVAGRSRTAPGFNYNILMVRKELADSGKVKSIADLKGLKFAFPAPGTAVQSQLNEVLKSAGLSIKDVQETYLAFPQQVPALLSKAIDGVILVDPFLSNAVSTGAATAITPTEAYYPTAEISMLFYGERMRKNDGKIGDRYMKAFLRAVRDYLAATEKGAWKKTPLADEIINIFAKQTGNDPKLVASLSMHPADPNGDLNLASLRKDLEFFKAQGLVTSNSITVDDIVDLRFAKAAAAELAGK